MNIQEKICAKMSHNAGIFLKMAAEEMSHFEASPGTAFSEDQTTVVVVFLQTAVELACACKLLKMEGYSAIASETNIPQCE